MIPAARGRTSRRHVRLFLGRMFRICRRHYGSLITLPVLAVALGVALTSSSFSSASHRQSAEQSQPPASRIQLPDGFRLDVEPLPVDRRVTYYLYEDEEQRKLLTDILRRDFTEMTRMGLPDYIGEVHFLRVESEAEQDYANYLISEVAAWAATHGLSVGIVDLR